MIDFTDQVAIVTGAGRGLGREYALEFARRGASVVVNDLGSSMHGDGADTTVAGRVVKEIEDAGGIAVASHDSVATSAGGAAIVATALDRFGRVDAVVSNAGIFETVAFDALTVDQWRSMLSVHLDGAFHLSQPAYRVMKGQGYGRFVFISSSAGMFGQPDSAHYAAAKSGIVGLSNVIAIEGADFDIRSNCVLPFGFSRMVWETVGGHEEIAEDSSFYRAIAPELVVPIVVFLASRTCELSHHNYSAFAGRFARVFVGLAEGWIGTSESLSADDVAAHLAAVTATEPSMIPASIFDEIGDMCARLGIT